jgi:ABC-type branched-subunit amino acid transport system permease subunit
VIVGGMGNLGGIVVGSVVVVGLQQAFQYIPSVGASEVGVALQVGLAALVTIIFLWLRPQGILPERLHRIYGRARGASERGPDVQAEPEPEVVAVRAGS